MSLSIATVVKEQLHVPIVTETRACIRVLVPPCLSGNRHGTSWVVSSARPTRLFRGEPTCRCRPWLRTAKARGFSGILLHLDNAVTLPSEVSLYPLYKCIARSCYAGVVTAESALSTDAGQQFFDVHGGRCLLRQEVGGEYHWHGERDAHLLEGNSYLVLGPRSLTSVASLCTANLPAQNVCCSVVAR